ncbi:MAG TPA: NAD(P)H-dependent oxidoreductase subunit E [Vicinamibacterales bacterium]|nr:NAD(P)H-dependent oxidoreductase subunit E [Vicinamibacterales bacterium]
MDLHIVGAEPSDEERAAVDALLGPPESGWFGGRRNAVADGRTSYGGLQTVTDRRDLLLPALHAAQDRIGWISRGALNYICRRLVVPPAEAWGVVTFYHLFETEPHDPIAIHVCDDIACRLRGAESLFAEHLAPAGSHPAPSTRHAAPAAWHRSPCLGLCDHAPAALIVRAGATPSADVVTSIASAAEITTAIQGAGTTARSFSRASDETGPIKLLRRVGVVDPTSLESYRTHGGYRALARAFALGPAGVIQQVVTANLLGRGGAAFPTGRKWEAVAREAAQPHFIVCNADESEPGTFKDRILLEDDPFALIEAMTIAAFATGCEHGFIYIRGEYPLARQRVQQAIDTARAAGLLGARVMEHAVAFDLEIRRGAGAYICGEETALFNSLEGKRGEPRSKPPFPAQVGLFGKPTVVNNVETLFNVIDIVLEGGEAWAQVGTKASTGTRLFCLSGHVTRPGLYEAPFGITLGELLQRAGGVANGRALQAILLGGAAGSFVGPDALAMPLTFEDARAAGTTLGSGVVMVFDDTADLTDTLLRIAQFMQDESCGQCVPCRVGTVRQTELLERLRDGARRGAATREDLLLLTELGQAMRDASICGLGQTASSAIESAVSRLQVFRQGGAA